MISILYFILCFSFKVFACKLIDPEIFQYIQTPLPSRNNLKLKEILQRKWWTINTAVLYKDWLFLELETLFAGE